MIINKFKLKQFIIVVLITSLWINASEVFRYFVFVMPQVQAFWEGVNRPIAEMDMVIFSIWGFWNTLLTALLVFIVWLFIQVFGESLKSIFISSTIVWTAIFVIFWVAASNMGFSGWSILLIALPLSWLEMFVGGWIASRLYNVKKWS